MCVQYFDAATDQSKKHELDTCTSMCRRENIDIHNDTSTCNIFHLARFLFFSPSQAGNEKKDFAQLRCRVGRWKCFKSANVCSSSALERFINPESSTYSDNGLASHFASIFRTWKGFFLACFAFMCSHNMYTPIFPYQYIILFLAAYVSVFLCSVFCFTRKIFSSRQEIDKSDKFLMLKDSRIFFSAWKMRIFQAFNFWVLEWRRKGIYHEASNCGFIARYQKIWISISFTKKAQSTDM